MPKYYLDEVSIPNNMNYRIFNSALENGRLKNNINVQLPEVVINKRRNKGYKSVYQKDYSQLMRNIGLGLYEGLNNAAGYTMMGLSYPFMKAGMNKEYSYKDATEPFNYGTNLDEAPLGHEYDNIINVTSGRSGQRDRLQMLGLVKDPDNGHYYTRNPNYNPKSTQADRDLDEWNQFLGKKANNTVRKYLTWCAENSNPLNGMMGRPTAGDAWTRHGIYGDSVIVVNPNISKKGRRFVRNINSVNTSNADYVEENIDKHNLMTGDIVDLGHPGSGSEYRAWREGDYNRSNSHTGTILRTGPDKRQTYVLHYGGKDKGVVAEPIGNMIGFSLTRDYITGIRRPGTKHHPYVDNNGRITYNKRQEIRHPSLNRNLLAKNK